MKFHIFVLFAVITLLSSFLTVSAQVDSVIGQVTSGVAGSFAGGISGDGRFVVFESTTNAATDNPRNSDGNREIFLFDYAQRRIFQLTDTKSLLTNTANSPTFDNIKVDIVSVRPVISNDGRWIAFSSNATCAYPGNGTIPPIVSATNPGSFDPNATTANDCLTGTAPNQTNNLVNDGNTEMWLYQVPAVAPVANLSAGDEIPLTNLAGGTFTRVTNSLPSRLPVPGSTSSFAIIADDNHDSSIDDTGAAISFTSNRNLVGNGNPAPNSDNDEIFTFVRAGSVLTQVSSTLRGSIGNPIYSANSTITNLADGSWRVAFLCNGNNPIIGMTGGNNSDNNEEIFYADLTADGTLGTTKKQVTATTRTNAGDVVNILNYGRRMSRDGRYIAFDSYADLTGTSANQPGFATFVFDTTATEAPFFRQIGVRSDADSAAAGGDLQRYPGFTDYDANRAPAALVLETRMNIRPDGTIPTTSSEGLNDNASRPAQVYSYPLPVSTTAIFTRLTKFPTPVFLASVQPLPSNSRQRISFNLANTETGTGNTDFSSEVYYSVLPTVASQIASNISFETGASRIPVSASPVPTPSPTATPTPTPTPTTTPSPTPTPTPQQPPAVQGVSRGMLAVVNFNARTFQSTTTRTAVGSLERRFTLPIELSGVSMTINGAAVGIKSFNRFQLERQIEFVVPPGLAATSAGTVYPVVINDNGTVVKGEITVVPARPDIFTTLPTPGPGGRARIFNATNRVLTTEPFTTTTFRLRGSRRVPTVFRLYLTGVQDLNASAITVRIGSREFAAGGSDLPPLTLVEPGVFTLDFRLPCEIPRGQTCSLNGAGDQPIVVSVIINGVTYVSRLDDTAARLFIL